MQRYSFPTILIITSLFIHLSLCTIFINICDYNIYGVALASFITMMINLIASIVYILIENPCPDSLFLFDRNLFNIKETIPYIHLSLYSALQHFGDAIGYEIVTFMSIYLGSVNMSANIIVLNFVTLISYIYLGMSIPLTHFVGYFFGKTDYDMCKYTIKFFAILNFIIGIVESLVTFVFSYYIANFYTNNIETIELASSVLKFYAIFFI